MSLVSDRRRFVQTMLAAATFPSLAAQPLERTSGYVLSIGTPLEGRVIPVDFVGLSYEVMQLEDPRFFSATNTSLVDNFKKISPNGVLRLGGNTSEFSWWKDDPFKTPPVRKTGVADSGEPPPDTLYAITPEAIRELKGFLDATGWSCIYGLNLGYGTPEVDVREAVFVANALEHKLQYFQIGNEVDLFWRHLRDKRDWNADTYLKEWLGIARAVQAAVPSATFGMPDVASDVTWLGQIADRWASVSEKVNVSTLSHHYYFGGPPANPNVNLDALLRPDPKVAQYAALAKLAADKMHVRLRMTEGNTCYQGGKPGVSDVLGSALWAADYAFTLMTLGYSGVNLHGGSGHAVAVSVGGMLRGEQLMHDPRAAHAKPFYTPIALDESSTPATFHLQPVGIGLAFASTFAGSTLLHTELRNYGDSAAGKSVAAHSAPVGGQSSSRSLSAFAGVKSNGKTLIALINSGSIAASVRLPASRVLQSITGSSLQSPKAELIGSADRPDGVVQSDFSVPATTAMLFEVQSNPSDRSAPEHVQT